MKYGNFLVKIRAQSLLLHLLSIFGNKNDNCIEKHSAKWMFRRFIRCRSKGRITEDEKMMRIGRRERERERGGEGGKKGL